MSKQTKHKHEPPCTIIKAFEQSVKMCTCTFYRKASTPPKTLYFLVDQLINKSIDRSINQSQPEKCHDFLFSDCPRVIPHLDVFLSILVLCRQFRRIKPDLSRPVFSRLSPFDYTMISPLRHILFPTLISTLDTSERIS